jgi:hypothetical protein
VRRIAIVTCAELPDLDPDDRLLAPALTALGIDSEIVSWDDPVADWAAYDLVAVRNSWDYAARREEFLAWAGSVPRIVNPPEVLEWTTDKRYMAELEAAGLPVVHSEFVDSPGARIEAGPEGVVVKPAIGAGSVDAGRHSDPGQAAAHVEELVASGRTALVQPFLPGISERGETALMYFGGVYSHAIHKGPMLPERGIVRPYGLFQPESIVAREPTTAERAVADRVMAWVAGRFGVLAYARIDVVPGPAGAPVVLECELSEPSLFLGTSAGAADRLAHGLAEKIC